LKSKQFLQLARTLCYIVVYLNLIVFITLTFTQLPNQNQEHLFENHPFYMLSFIIAGASLLAKFRNLYYFRVICWYCGMILLLTSLLLFIETTIYANFISAFFDIHEKASLIAICCYVLISICLFDFSLSKITRRTLIIAIAIFFISSMTSLFDLTHLVNTNLSIYSSINFMLLALSLIFYICSNFSKTM
jgi:hypothetical protein